MRVLELRREVRHEALVPVVATEVVVAGGRLDLDDAVADLEQRHVERASTEVEHQDRLLLLALVEAVGERCRGRLVDDAQHVEACDLAGLLGGLALGVVEVRRHRDDRVGDGVTEVGLRITLELLQHACADLLRGVGLAVDVDGPAGAHVALHGANGAVDVGDGLTLGNLADKNFAVLGEGDDRRRRTGALGVGDDGGLSALEDRHHGVGGAEVDSDCSCHGDSSFFRTRGAWGLVVGPRTLPESSLARLTCPVNLTSTTCESARLNLLDITLEQCRSFPYPSGCRVTCVTTRHRM